MTVTILTVLSLAVIVLIGCLVLVTVTFSKSLQRVADHADRVHERSDKSLHKVLDRLMAKNFEEFKIHDLGEGELGSVTYPPGESVRNPWDVPPVYQEEVRSG